jgi:hypothetical protein
VGSSPTFASAFAPGLFICGKCAGSRQILIAGATFFFAIFGHYKAGAFPQLTMSSAVLLVGR